MFLNCGHISPEGEINDVLHQHAHKIGDSWLRNQTAVLSSPPLSWFMPSAHQGEAARTLPLMKQLRKGISNCSCLKKKKWFAHFSPLHPPPHTHCLAFTCRALWLSLSPVCTTDRVNLRLPWTGLCRRFTSLCRCTEAWRRSAVGCELTERTSEPWSVQSVRRYYASVLFFFFFLQSWDRARVQDDCLKRGLEQPV